MFLLEWLVALVQPRTFFCRTIEKLDCMSGVSLPHGNYSGIMHHCCLSWTSRFFELLNSPVLSFFLRMTLEVHIGRAGDGAHEMARQAESQATGHN